MTDSLCVCCKSNPIKYKKWRLCEKCYTRLRNNGTLHNMPTIPIITRRRDSLTKKYGEDILGDFSGLFKHDYTLQDIGEKYGFTRERARQIFESIFGFKYTAIVNVRKAKHEEVKRERLSRRDPRAKFKRYKPGLAKKGAKSEVAVFNICAKMGYEIRPYVEGNTIDLIINGYKVEIKSAYTTVKTSKGSITGLYRFRRLPTQRIADYVVCHAVPINKFFVIPSSVISGDHFYIPEKKVMTWRNSKQVRISHWYDYEEAWHLLRPQEGDVVFSKAASQ